MKNLFILGAGASKVAGGPLMNEFLEKAAQVNRLGKVADAKEAFDNVSDAISELQSIYAKSYLPLDNIETLFSAIEMGLIINKFGDRQADQISLLRDSIITVIVKTLEHSIEFPVQRSEHGGRVTPPKGYDRFIDMLVQIDEELSPNVQHEYCFVTFNYDLALDYALFYHEMKSDYCLPGEERGGSPLLKLHGSINWGECEECKHIIPVGVDGVVAQFDPLTINELPNVWFDVGSRLPEFKQHCDEAIKGPPVLVPPTWNKASYHQDLLHVWRRAAKELAEADNIFVMGYSLPETDSFFKYLFALGTQSRTQLRRFWVFDPNVVEVEKRFRGLLGGDIKDRAVFKKKVFSDAIFEIGDELKQP